MNSAIERILSLRVSDVMNRNLVQVPADATMADAAQILSRAEVTGAPVVDEQGQCVGLLSGTDFTLRQLIGDVLKELDAPGDGHVSDSANGSPSSRSEDVANDRVTQHMSSPVKAIDGSAPMIHAARRMCADHIHRVIVLDHSQHAVGVISSLDVVSALIKAVDE